MKRIDRTLSDGIVRQSYERFLLSQPQLEFGGLWFKDDVYYIVCRRSPTHEAGPDHGTIKDRFWMYEMMGSPPTEVVADVPVGADRVPCRSAEDLALLHGSSRTFPELVLALNLALPREFPNFRLEGSSLECTAILERELSDEESRAFIDACHAVGIKRIKQIRVDSDASRHSNFIHVFGSKIGDAGDDLYLTPSRRLSPNVPQRLRWIVEDDEDFWRDRRKQLLATTEIEQPAEVLPTKWHVPEASCVLDPRAYPANNIRNYLSIFRQVLLVLPTVDQLDQKLNELRIGAKDLVELVRIGRVSLLLPESIDRYPYQILAPLAEDVPERLLASRRLAAATIVDTRKRLPFFYPASSVEERYQFLHELANTSLQAGDDELRRFRMALVKAVSDAWSMGELGVHHSGGAATSLLGIGQLCAGRVMAETGHDYWSEFVTAAAGVEWAGALGATIAPAPDAEPYTDLLAAYYSRVHAAGVPSIQPEVHRLVKRVLVLNDDAPVLQFATAFSGADIDRLRDCLQNMAKWNADQEELEIAVDGFNKSIMALERQQHKLAPMDILQLAPIVGGISGAIPGTISVWIGLGMWVAKNLVPFASNRLAAHSKTVSAIFDQVNGLLTRSPRDAVLVARMRKQARG